MCFFLLLMLLHDYKMKRKRNRPTTQKLLFKNWKNNSPNRKSCHLLQMCCIKPTQVLINIIRISKIKKWNKICMLDYELTWT